MIDDPRACRKCGCCHSYTTSTRIMKGGRVARYRQCRHCGKRFVTYEISAKNAGNLEKK